jgi:hypothetical protein
MASLTSQVLHPSSEYRSRPNSKSPLTPSPHR